MKFGKPTDERFVELQIKRYSELIGMSALEAAPAVAAARLGRLQTERDAADTAAAMATLSMHHAASTSTLPMQ